MNGRVMRLRIKIGIRRSAKYFIYLGKAIWSLIQLLVIPAFLALVVYCFNQNETKRVESVEATRIVEQRSIEATRIVEQRSIEATRIVEQQYIESDRANEETLRNYFDSMNRLLLDKNIRMPNVDDNGKSIARTITLSALQSLDTYRKEELLWFLVESDLIQGEPKMEITPTISLASANMKDVFLWRDYQFEVDLSGAEPDGIDMKGADLRGADLSGAFLASADLGFADLSYAHLSGATLWVSFLQEANLIGGFLNEADFSGAYMFKADLTSANLIEANLEDAKLIEAILQWADLSEACLIDANLTKANLTGANLTRANLTGADLTRANLAGANLSGADLSRAKITNRELAKAFSLKSATLPDGQIYNPTIHIEIARLRKDAGLVE